MVSKTITVVDASNSEHKKRLSNEHGYRNLISGFGVACLKDGDGVELEDFESLVDDGKYTLGPPPQQQPEQQQQQPPAAPDAAVSIQEQVNTRSSEILNSWCQQTQGVPALRGLPGVVQAPLPMALPSTHSIVVTDPPVDDVISTDLSSNVVPELGRLRDSIHALQRFGESEDSVHSLVDTLILSPIVMIGGLTNCPFTTGRNGVDRSGDTVANLRPDVLVWLPSGVLAFKGEDKATANDIGVARDELITKLNCFSETYFGRVPYQLCYAAGGNMLQFWVIQRPQASGTATLSPITSPVDLSTVRGRSLCVRYAVNISRILVTLQANFPESSVVKLGAQIKTSLSVVNILGEYVVKKTSRFTDGDVLTRLYSQIKASSVPGLLTPRQWNISRNGMLTLHIGPVGFCGKRPESVAEAKMAGRRLLLALEWLHRHGWVHRDIRPENIMCADGHWYLNDLEWANVVDSDLGNCSPNEQRLPPELVGVEGMPWTAACDMWQVGKLLEGWNQLDDSGQGYVRTQTKDDPQHRLSAKLSLAHDFFVLSQKNITTLSSRRTGI